MLTSYPLQCFDSALQVGCQFANENRKTTDNNVADHCSTIVGLESSAFAFCN